MQQYGYVRVSSVAQNLDRQINEILEFGINKTNIYSDKQSGRDFERCNYKILINKLKKGDLLVIKSIDRLGRNYSMIVNEWGKITKTIEADILVLDMPLLDTRQKTNNLVGRLISDLVLQLLSFVAENECDNIRQRQAEGIKIAKQKGVKFGRPKILLPKNFENIIALYQSHKISNIEASSLLGISKSSFFRLLKTIT
ncbi:MAG: recombinase family protein [Bacilli bacterium]